MKLQQLCVAAGIECGSYGDIDINKIKTNSNKVEKGDLFVCISGLHEDGHKYAMEAQKNGATAILAEHEICVNIPVVICRNTRQILPYICDAYFGYPSKRLKLVGVTGTNGKTSVTYMLKAIFDAAMYKTGLIGTVCCMIGDRDVEMVANDPLANMTTPDPIELFEIFSKMADEGVEYVFMEASSHALALMKLDGLEFEAAVFTNLTPEHLDFHRDMEDYFTAKSRLFEHAKIKIINIDDPYGKRLYEMQDSGAYRCSTNEKCSDFFAEDIKDMGMDGIGYRMAAPCGRFSVKSSVAGGFNIMNTMEAAACALSLGVPQSTVLTALSVFNGVSGRMERVRIGGLRDFSVFIDYAHTPDALENLLKTVNEQKGCRRRIVLVFGCGGDRDKSKRRIMGKIAAKYADLCIVTSDNSRNEEPCDIINEILKGVGDAPHLVIENRKAAIEYAIKEAKSGDIILLSGKGHEQYEIDKSGKHYFCEKQIVREAICNR